MSRLQSEWRPSAAAAAPAEAASPARAAGAPPPAIVHVVREPAISGSQRVALDILGDAALAGFRRVIVAGGEANASAPFIDETARLGVERLHLDSLCRDVGGGDLQALRDLRRAFRELRPALVHTHSAKPFLLAGVAACLEGVPRRVHTLHGISFHRFTPRLARPFYYALEQIGTLFYHRVVSVNDYYRRYYPLARARRALAVIPNGIALPARPAAPPAVRPGEFPVLFAGRLDAQKDPLFVLEVAASIDRHWDSRLEPRFYVAGDGPLAESMRSGIAARGLGDRVVLLGWVDDLAGWYAAARVLLLPSRWEACGLVLIEAGARGCPSVAARVEGVPEVVRDGESGLLFEQGDVAAACRHLARLARDEALRQELGARARQDAERRDSAAMTSRYVELYRSLGLAA